MFISHRGCAPLASAASAILHSSVQAPSPGVSTHVSHTSSPSQTSKDVFLRIFQKSVET